MLATIGFLVILAILAVVLKKKWSPVVALAIIPILGCIATGNIASINKFAASGIAAIASTGIMFVFSSIFFGIMRDNGSMDPLTTAIIKFTKGDPIRVCIGAYLLSILGHLDGTGITTIMLVVPPMLPIYDRLKIHRFALGFPLAAAIGIMNAVPWGGPTMRAATTLQMDVMELWVPFIPTQIFGLLVAGVMTYMYGRREKRRLIAAGLLDEPEAFSIEKYLVIPTEEELKLKRPKLIVINWVLIVAVLGLMVAGLLAPAPAFIIGVVLALAINYHSLAIQRKIIDEHAKDSIALATVIFAAGILMGIMKDTGMSAAMAKVMISVIPVSLSPFIAPIIGVLSVPLSIFFDADSYYYGILPVIVETVKAFGISGIDVARASMVGVITVGWSVSPMVGTFFLFTGILDLDMGEWQKFAILPMIFLTVVMTIFLCVTGVIPIF